MTSHSPQNENQRFRMSHNVHQALRVLIAFPAAALSCYSRHDSLLACPGTSHGDSCLRAFASIIPSLRNPLSHAHYLASLRPLFKHLPLQCALPWPLCLKRHPTPNFPPCFYSIVVFFFNHPLPYCTSPPTFQ